MPGHDFQHSILQGMRNVFGFKSGFNVQGIATVGESPANAQPVLDVGRFASIGSGIGAVGDGWWIIRQRVVLAIASANGNAELDVYGVFPAGAFPPGAVVFREQYRCWFYGAWFAHTITVAAEFDNATLGLVGSALEGISVNSGLDVGRVIGRWVSTDSLSIASASWVFAPTMPTAREFIYIPHLMQPGATLLFDVNRTGTLGTTTAHFNVLVWFGRRGAIPPGQ